MIEMEWPFLNSYEDNRDLDLRIKKYHMFKENKVLCQEETGGHFGNHQLAYNA